MLYGEVLTDGVGRLLDAEHLDVGSAKSVPCKGRVLAVDSHVPQSTQHPPRLRPHFPSLVPYTGSSTTLAWAPASSAFRSSCSTFGRARSADACIWGAPLSHCSLVLLTRLPFPCLAVPLPTATRRYPHVNTVVGIEISPSRFAIGAAALRKFARRRGVSSVLSVPPAPPPVP